MQRAVAIIPARYNSTRFPGKPLALLRRKPVIQHVFEKVKNARLVDTVLVATDDERIYNTVTEFGGKAVMTSDAHSTGTDRVAEAAKDIDCDIVVNIQGDEPFIKPEMVDDLVNMLADDKRALMGTLAKRITDSKEIFSPDVVKVVMDNEGFAMYFSRAPIPWHRDEFSKFQDSDFKAGNGQPATGIIEVYKHIGIYGYRKDTLLSLSTMEENALEKLEKLEQLRALGSGIKIKVKETDYDTFGIDTVEDLRNAEEYLIRNG
ncbi:MAG: 3-deoxy-manno-octulosonate cytidylyltransferase [Nitrospirae bacterium]|nr:3-deoxy-manno-octulosonate cytidylyltransferase [Nitrospirota bacterium]